MKINCFVLSVILFCSVFVNIQAKDKSSEKYVVAYVTSWSRIIPDPMCMTHINYAFGHVNETFDGVRIDNESRLKSIVELKKQNPHLKVLLSIGGWGSGRFSEMASDKKNREAFAKDCKRIVKEFNLDGIDIDWEYPTSSSAKISSSPDDTKNYTLLMRDIRKTIGKGKLLTLASAANAKYVDFKAIDSYIDFVNIMSYDMGGAPKHHAALFRSGNAGGTTSEEAVDAHLAAGVPLHKLTLGIPFYGRGGKPLSNFMDYKLIEKEDGYMRKWDDVAKVPYLVDAEGVFIMGYDDPRSIAIKCDYIHQRGLLGGMYWDYNGDNEAGDLRHAVYEGVMKK